MNQNEALDAIENFLQQHKDCLGGSVHEEAHKMDFFRIFATAFNSGLNLSADALSESLASRLPQLVVKQPWVDLRMFWQEWTYAWRHIKLCRHG